MRVRILDSKDYDGMQRMSSWTCFIHLCLFKLSIGLIKSLCIGAKRAKKISSTTFFGMFKEGFIAIRVFVDGDYELPLIWDFNVLKSNLEDYWTIQKNSSMTLGKVFSYECS